MLGFDKGFYAGYEKCYEEFLGREIKRGELKEEARKSQLYFLRQRILGILMLILTVIVVWALEGDCTIGLVTIPLALLLIFSKERMCVGGNEDE